MTIFSLLIFLFIVSQKLFSYDGFLHFYVANAETIRINQSSFQDLSREKITIAMEEQEAVISGNDPVSKAKRKRAGMFLIVFGFQCLKITYIFFLFV